MISWLAAAGAVRAQERVVTGSVVQISGFCDSYPSWSPDGTKIVFESNRAGNHDIWIMDADGSDPVRLTDHAAMDETPVFSPDGELIAQR